MPAQDRMQRFVNVGDIVNIPGTVTAIGGTDARPTVTISTKYVGFDGNADALGPVDMIQVLKDEQSPRN